MAPKFPMKGRRGPREVPGRVIGTFRKLGKGEARPKAKPKARGKAKGKARAVEGGAVDGRTLAKELKALLTKPWAEYTPKEQKEIMLQLSNPGRSVYNSFHRTMATDASLPDHFQQDCGCRSNVN